MMLKEIAAMFLFLVLALHSNENNLIYFLQQLGE